MNETITKTPSRKNTPCAMCTPYSPRLNRLATAQPPAKAAPNTSAPIRIAALTTVRTWTQTILRRPECPVGSFMAEVLMRRALSPKPATCQERRSPRSCRVSLGFRSQQPGFHQRQADAVDLGGAKLDQRRAHHRPRQAPEQHQCLFHAVVHVGPRFGIEHPRQRVDAVVEPPRRREVVVLHRAEQLRLQIGNDAAAA